MTSVHSPCTSCPTCTTPRGLSRRHAITGVAAAGLGTALLAACSGGGDSAADGGSSGGEGSGMAGPLGPTADIPEGGGVIFSDAGVVVTQPAAGEFKAFSVTCTHRGCAVSEVGETIVCTCHGSEFSLEDGSPLEGPAENPLDEVPITVEGDQVVLG